MVKPFGVQQIGLGDLGSTSAGMLSSVNLMPGKLSAAGAASSVHSLLLVGSVLHSWQLVAAGVAAGLQRLREPACVHERLTCLFAGSFSPDPLRVLFGTSGLLPAICLLSQEHEGPVEQRSGCAGCGQLGC